MDLIGASLIGLFGLLAIGYLYGFTKIFIRLMDLERVLDGLRSQNSSLSKEIVDLKALSDKAKSLEDQMDLLSRDHRRKEHNSLSRGMLMDREV